MNAKKNYSKGTRHEIVTLALMCGCLPMKRLPLLSANHRTMLAKLREMQNEGVLEEIQRKDRWVFTFTTQGKNLPDLELFFSPTLLNHYRNFSINDEKKVRGKSDSKDSMEDANRIIKNTTTILFFYGIDFKSIVGERPNLAMQETKGIKNSYYTSREVKAYKNLEGDKDRNNTVETTRLSGLCITYGGNYVAFQMGKSILDFTEKGEGKAKVYIEQMLFEKQLGALSGSILLSDKESNIKSLVEPISKKAEIRLNGMFNVYENIYFLTNNKVGQQMMEIMAMPDWDEIIYAATLSKEQRAGRSTTSIDCDGYKDGIHYMVYCVPNIARLKRFYGAAKLMRNKNNYIVYCYKHQEHLLQEVLGEHCLVQSANFNDLYSYMKGRQHGK